MSKYRNEVSSSVGRQVTGYNVLKTNFHLRAIKATKICEVDGFAIVAKMSYTANQQLVFVIT